ncbi:hypothetical protein NL676_008315 [Syzygium grande]|nr:hypothetical protein NL676_008315 [Syzygium grande]
MCADEVQKVDIIWIKSSPEYALLRINNLRGLPVRSHICDGVHEAFEAKKRLDPQKCPKYVHRGFPSPDANAFGKCFHSYPVDQSSKITVGNGSISGP